MLEQDRIQLIALVERRISELQEALSESSPVADKKQNQADDSAANLDLTINASVDEKIHSEQKLALAQLSKNVEWLQSDEAGICVRCGATSQPIG